MPDDVPAEDLLIVRAQMGEEAAFRGLLDAHLLALRAFIALKLPVPHLIEEIAHETFVFAFQHIADFRVGTSFRAWLRAIAWNLVRREMLRFSREQANRSRYAEHRAWAGAAPHLEGDEVEALEDCLRRLPPAMQQLLRMQYHDGASGEDIAAALSRSLTWVRVTLFRVRQQLRECIERKLPSHAG